MTQEHLQTQELRLPSGYSSVEQLPQKSLVSPEQLPWLDSPVELSTVRCTLQGGETFLFASAVGTHADLIAAASKMTTQQDKNTNNMLYSRLAGFVSDGFSSPLVSAFNSLPGGLAMSNRGGQRVYLTMASRPDSPERLFIKVAACDKNNQGKVINVIDRVSSDKKSRILRNRGGF